MKTNKKGFTLGELLVVVAIIGVLVAITIPVFHGKLQKAKDAREIANIRNSIIASQTEYLNDGELEKGYYFYNVKQGTILNIGKNHSSLINSTYNMPTRKKKSGNFIIIYVLFDIDDEEAPIKTYPYIDENGEIEFKSMGDGEFNGEKYDCVTPRTAYRRARKNNFNK